MSSDNGQEINTNTQQEEPYTSEEKAAKKQRRFEKQVLIFLIVVVVVGLPFSIWQMGRHIASPFEYRPSNFNLNASQVGQANTNVQRARIEDLRNKDTDQDGLNDYDELYVHLTSPYIADSDSDTINDRDEINLGKDPNCPGEEVCAREGTNSNANTNSSQTNSTSTDLTNLSTDQLRQIMRDAGASEQQLATISDEDLLQSYRDILTEEGSDIGLANSNTNSSQSFDYSGLDYEELFNMSAADIRLLLIDSGVSQDTLNQVDDDTLRQIYLESLNNNLTTNSNTNSAG